MRLIFIGVQGSGKGTQAEIISKKFSIAHISTGELLRNTKGKLKKQIDRDMDKGELIPDRLIINILKQRIKEKDCKKGFIIDGFPRNIEQAQKLNKITYIDRVIEIHLSDKAAIKRLEARRICPKCGTNYNLVTSPKPKRKEICDKCGSILIKRKDDTKSAIKKRLKIYHEKTEPILVYYKDKLFRINGEQEIKKVAKEIIDLLKIR
jgi:adenylate kinase